MSAKEKKKISKIALILAIIMLLVICIYIKFISNKEIYATDEKSNKTHGIRDDVFTLHHIRIQHGTGRGQDNHGNR